MISPLNFDGSRLTRSCLSAVLKYIHALGTAALACRHNFTWLELSNGNTIPLFGPDLLAAALPSLGQMRATYNPPQDTSDSQINEFLGPNTLKHFITVCPRYSLPQGTLLELTNLQKQSRQDTLKHSEDLERSFHQTIATLSRRTARARAIDVSAIADQFAAFSSGIQEFDLLTSVLNRATPLEDLVSSKRAMFDRPAYETFFSQLQKDRHGTPESNHCNAINAGIIVSLVNNSFRDSQLLLPVLISNAEVMLDNSRLIEKSLQLRDLHAHLPSLVGNTMFFILFQTISNKVDRSFGIGADHCAQIQITCDRIGHLIEELLGQIPSDAMELPLTDGVIEYHYLALRAEISFLLRDWGPTFTPLAHAEQLDRIGWMNSILSNRYVNILPAPSSQRMKRSIQTLRDHLRERIDRSEFWQWASSISIFDKNGKPSKADRYCVYTMVPNDGTPLTMVKDEHPMEPIDPSILAGEHNVRVLARSESWEPTSAIAIDSWRTNRSRVRWLRFVWLHNSDLEYLWNRAVSAMRVLLSPKDVPRDRLKFRFFTSRGLLKGSHRPGCWKLPIGRFDSETIGFFDVKMADFTFYADIVPLEDIELQAGLIVPAHLWSRKTKEVLLGLLASRGRGALAPVICQHFLESVAAHFDLDHDFLTETT